MKADLARHVVCALLLACAPACAPPEMMIHTEPGDPIGHGTLIVANGGAASVSLVDALTGDRLIDLPVGDGPADVAVSPDGRLAVVSNRGTAHPGATLTVVDMLTASVLGEINLGQHSSPGGLQFLPNGRRLLAVSGGTGQLLVLDALGRRLVRAVSTGHERSEQLAIEPDGQRVWISHGDGGAVTAIDVDSLQVVAEVTAGQSAAGLDLRPDGEELWVCDPAGDALAIFDTAERTLSTTLPCFGGPTRVHFTPDGQRAIVACARTADIAIFAVGKPHLVTRIPLTITPLEAGDSRVFGRVLDPGTALDITPGDLLPSRDGLHVWVSHPFANIVTVLDLDHLDVRGRDRAAGQPQGLGWSKLVPGQY